MTEQNFEPGTLLVAHPQFEDPSFGKSVILVLMRGEDGGAIGVNIAEKPLKGRLYIGGPLAAPLPVMVHESTEGVESSRPIGETGYSVTAIYPAPNGKVEPAALLLKQLDKSAVYMGYAGWGAGQLEGEAQMGVWTRTKLSLDDLMSTPVEERWTKAATEAGLIAPEKPAAKPPAP